MSDGVDVTDADLIKAEELAKLLEEKIGKYFPEPPQESRHAEMNVLRAQLEKLGFTYNYSISLNAVTFACTATVTLIPIEKPSVFH